MALRSLKYAVLKFSAVWLASFVVANTLFLLVVVILPFAILIAVNKFPPCLGRSKPTIAEAHPLAEAELAMFAKGYRMTAGQFVLKETRSPNWLTPSVWEFVYQVADDVERPRKVSVFVDRCRHTEYRADLWMGWDELAN